MLVYFPGYQGGMGANSGYSQPMSGGAMSGPPSQG